MIREFSEDELGELEAAVAEAGKSLGRVQKESQPSPSNITIRRREQDVIERERKALGPIGSDLLLGAAEVQYFLATRRLLLARHGLSESSLGARFSVKTQPERLGVLVMCLYLDRLAAVDPKQGYDAIFVPEVEQTELWWAMEQPKEAAVRWQKRLKAEGKTWSPEWRQTQLDMFEAGTFKELSREDYKKMRAILYPNKGDAQNQRRALMQVEVQETLRAVSAELNGEPPHAISMLMKLDVDNLTPVQALSTLKHLQDVARRRDIGPRLFDNP